ncbi:MAG: class B sortase [Acetatifactor sp.]|nr:class B sortase [Acetatifactor sp.]
MADMDRDRDRHTRRKEERTRYIVAAVLICVAVVAGAVWGVQTYRSRQAERELALLAEQSRTDVENTRSGTDVQTEEAVTDSLQALREMGVPIPEKDVDFAALQEETNADIYAWIYVPDTQIDYPIVQHPTDNSYYLNYNLDGSKGYPGCIYTENYNKKDFSDPNTVIYGHNMKNGSMFAGLHLFEDSEFFEEHPYVYIYTEDGLLVYEIFAAHQSGNEHILYTYDFDSDTVYRNYLEDIFETRSMNSNIREDAEVTEENRIITLSTCISSKPNNRYLVQGVLLNED